MQLCNLSILQWCNLLFRMYGLISVGVLMGSVLSFQNTSWIEKVVNSYGIPWPPPESNAYVTSLWSVDSQSSRNSSKDIITRFQAISYLLYREHISQDIVKRRESRKAKRKDHYSPNLSHRKITHQYIDSTLTKSSQNLSANQFQSLQRAPLPMSNNQETIMNTITSGMQSTCITRQARQPRRVIASPQVVEAAANQWTNSLIGKIFTHEPINYDDMKEEINLIWSREKRVTIKRVQHNLFIFKFQTEEAQEEVLFRAPWSVNGYLLGLQKYDTRKEPVQHNFLSQVWRVNLRGASQLFLNEDLVNEICKDLGTRVLPQNRRRLPRGSMLYSPSIEIRLTEPLRRGGWIESAAGVKVWVKYHFEKQPYNICKKCYVVDHRESLCEAIEQELKVDQMTEAEFQFWKLHTEEGRKYMETLIETEKKEELQSEFCIGEGSNNNTIELDQEVEKQDRGSKRQRGEEMESNKVEERTENHTVNVQGEILARQNTTIPTARDHTEEGHSEIEAGFEITQSQHVLSANQVIVSEQKASSMMEE